MLPNLTLLNRINLTKDCEYLFYSHDIDFKGKFPKIIGIDPGTSHMGIAEVGFLYVSLWEITIPRGKTSAERIYQIWNILSEYPLQDMKTIVIEGASYADRYRQIELQDIRCGATAWAMNRPGHNVTVQIIPPNTIRKVVFGSAKIKNPWKEMGIPSNSAAALGCALYPIMKEKQNELSK